MNSRFERSDRRRRARLIICVLATSLWRSTGFASAAQAQEASIIGQVTDESGAVLPGVTVTATSQHYRCLRSLTSPTSVANIA